MNTCTTEISISADNRIAPRTKSEKIRNVDQYGRTLVSDSPLATAAAANSRTPKCMLRPLAAPGSKCPAPSKVSAVFVDGDRSADPPTSQGTLRAIALRTLPDVSRDARPFGSAGK